MYTEFNYVNYVEFSDILDGADTSKYPIKFDNIMSIMSDMDIKSPSHDSLKLQVKDSRVLSIDARIAEPDISTNEQLKAVIKTLETYSRLIPALSDEITQIRSCFPNHISGCIRAIQKIRGTINNKILEKQRFIEHLPEGCLTFEELTNALGENGVVEALKELRRTEFTDPLCKNILEKSAELSPIYPQFFLWDAEGHTSVVMNCGGKEGTFYSVGIVNCLIFE